MKEVAIKFEQLGKAFQKEKESKEAEGLIWALKDISFTVHKGEAFGIVGENGAGKSTLLKIIAGITAPTAGRILLNGKVSSILEIGSGFHPELTGRENIYFNGKMLGFRKSEIDKRFDEIVAFSEIPEFIDVPVKYYSSGMFLRLAFSIVIHFDREIMVFDEVMAVGDVNFRRKCKDKVMELWNKGKTFLLVSHSLYDISSVCDKVLVLDKGEIRFLGPPEEALSHYLKRGEPTMIVNDATGKTEARQWKGELPSSINAFRKRGLNPANFIRLEQVRCLNEQREECREFTFEDKIRFEIEYQLMLANEGVAVTLFVEDIMQNRLFAVHTMDQDVSINNRPGRVALSWELPANTLNAGTYFLSLTVLHGNDVAYRFISIISFEIKGPFLMIRGKRIFLPFLNPGEFNCKSLSSTKL